MKELHLICNAHLDPVWQWEWHEGIAAAISTFESAERLMDRFDYVFCHNEAYLYACIETYAPDLFERIRQRVLDGKWKIMGGWYLQPDCNMPSGESLIRQIQRGLRYFDEKFGIKPQTAVSFDAFGHPIGLVQIIRKCGQKNYLYMRPKNQVLPDLQFIWDGLDGSALKCTRILEYSSPLGRAVEAIDGRAHIQKQMGTEIGVATWGIGNHGGGPSANDLVMIEQYRKESDIPVIHSDPDRFMQVLTPTAHYDKSLQPCMVGCYTSMIEVKQAHIALEEALYLTEIMSSYAEARGIAAYDADSLRYAEDALLMGEFHDILAGTCIQRGETYALRRLHAGLDCLDALQTKLFFLLSNQEQHATADEYPILVFNPHPYQIDTEIETEFSLADTFSNGKDMTFFMDGKELVCQESCPDGNLDSQIRKHYWIRVTLPPMSFSRISGWERPLTDKLPVLQEFKYENSHFCVEIDPLTGCLKRYSVNGTEYLATEICAAQYKDHDDPWQQDENIPQTLGKDPIPFTLCADTLQVIEDGPLFKKIEAQFICGGNRLWMTYIIHKTSCDVDIHVRLLVVDARSMYKMIIPTGEGQPIAQCPFGMDRVYTDGTESVMQRFAAINRNGSCLAVLNRSIYGCSFDENTLYLNLARTPAYCSKENAGDNRIIEHMDIGEHTYQFRLTVCPENELEQSSQRFCRTPIARCVFPIPDNHMAQERMRVAPVEICSDTITLVTWKKGQICTGEIFRLQNNSCDQISCPIRIYGTEQEIVFHPYEVKTFQFNKEHGVLECSEMLI